MQIPDIRDEDIAKLGATRQHEVVKALQELNWYRERSALSLYTPYPWQHRFHSLTTRVKCLFAANQVGKSHAAIAEALIQAVDRDWLPRHLQQYKRFEPPFRCRIFAASVQIVETVIFEKLRELVPLDQLAGGSWGTAYDKQLRIIHFANGSELGLFTYEQDVKKLGGATIDRIHYDEEPPKEVRQESRIRIMRRRGDELFTMTPTEGLSWTYRDLWEPWDTDPKSVPHIGVVGATWDEAPHLTEEAKAEALVDSSEEEILMRSTGAFIALHGLIFNDFNADCIVPERPLPSNVNVVVGIDPGMRYAAGVVWAYLTVDDVMVVFEEGYYQGLTARQVCDEIHKTNGRYDIEPIYYVIDPAARNKNHQSGRSDQMEYADHGILTIAGQNAVRPGINRIKERFQHNRLFVQKNCPYLIQELRHYRWKKPPRTEDEGRETPVKRDDHLIDALRYLVMSRPYLPERPDARNETTEQRLIREDIEDLSNPSDEHYAGVVQDSG